jgi:uncharacterized C2H2 Zn-finger protein
METVQESNVSVASTRHTDNPVSCPDCGKTFKNAWGLLMHTSKAHRVDGAKRKAKAKRKYTRRAAIQNGHVQAKPMPTSKREALCFCPGCGCNLAAVRMALELQ